jgi:hypothetical protein
MVCLFGFRGCNIAGFAKASSLDMALLGALGLVRYKIYRR